MRLELFNPELVEGVEKFKVELVPRSFSVAGVEQTENYLEIRSYNKKPR